MSDQWGAIQGRGQVMASVWRLDEDACVYHWVLAHTRERARALCNQAIVDANGQKSEAETIGCEKRDDSSSLKITFGHLSVELTCEEWAAVYDHKEMYLCCSEF